MSSFTSLIAVPVVIAILYIFRRRRAAFYDHNYSANNITTERKNDKLLFTVESCFTIEGRATVLTPGFENDRVKAGSKIKLIIADRVPLHTTILSIEFALHKNYETKLILISAALTKRDVPAGSEVWLDE